MPHTQNGSRALHAEPGTSVAIFERLFRKHAEVPHHFPEIEARESDFDLDVTRPGKTTGVGHPRQTFAIATPTVGETKYRAILGTAEKALAIYSSLGPENHTAGARE